MIILGYNPSHDGSLVLLKDGELIFSIEGEKDSDFRYSSINYFYGVVKSLNAMKEMPEVFALGKESGRIVTIKGYDYPYEGVEDSCKRIENLQIAGGKIKLFTGSHERSHIFCSYGLSPFPQGEPYYALCWEGWIGRFYYISPDLQITGFDTVVNSPGLRYMLPYFVAQKEILPDDLIFDQTMAGKAMALVGYGQRNEAEEQKWEAIIEKNIKFPIGRYDYETNYSKLITYTRKFRFNRAGVESHVFKNFMCHYSKAIFNKFYRYAKNHLKKKYPLLISGGCGLNCDWNAMWKDSGLFSDVFIPPCANDSGCGIGYAVDAQHHFTGKAKVKWTVYAGENFVHDAVPGNEFIASSMDYGELARLLAKNFVFAWVQGKYEIGPRALCNRSLIAAPFKGAMHRRLNRIKQRESYRPIAPVCTEESVSRFFKWQGESPYMLHFCKVLSPELKAVTHVDNSARVQTVRENQNPQMYKLLKKFEEETGYPVLCNTSLNFKGRGFINRTTDLITYVLNSDIDGMVIERRFYLKKGGTKKIKA